jgi:hypothetical protein
LLAALCKLTESSSSGDNKERSRCGVRPEEGRRLVHGSSRREEEMRELLVRGWNAELAFHGVRRKLEATEVLLRLELFQPN